MTINERIKIFRKRKNKIRREVKEKWRKLFVVFFLFFLHLKQKIGTIFAVFKKKKKLFKLFNFSLEGKTALDALKQKQDVKINR